jgi:hypothetical protein
MTRPPSDISFAVFSRDQLAARSAVELMQLLTSMDDRVPRTVMDECLHRPQELLPLIRDFLMDKGVWRPDLPDSQWWGLLHCVHLLGSMKGAEAADVLWCAFREINVADHGIGLWDWLEDEWPWLFRNHFDAVLPGLTAVAENRALDWYPRRLALVSLLFEVATRSPERLESTLDRIAVLIDKDSEDPCFRCRAGALLLSYARPRHRRLLNRLARLQEMRTDRAPLFSLEDIDAAYAGAAPETPIPFRDPLGFYDQKEIARRQNEWWREEEERRRREQEEREAIEADEYGIPILRVTP